jgi:predicted acylesterase/phospholipase RssA
MTLIVDLALQGGGSKGIALNASIAEIRRRGHVVRRVVGTSAGAIAATMIAAGFDDEELRVMSLGRTADDLPLFSEYVTEPIVPSFTETDAPLDEVRVAALRLPGDLGRRLLAAHAASAFLERGGFVSGDGFVDWLTRTLEGKRAGLSRATLAELHALTGCHLTVIATDTTARRLRALNHLSAPDCPLVAAVRMSMSIPLVFTEVVWRPDWGRYLGESIAGHVMVDGGVISNLPIGFVLPSANALVARIMGPMPAEPAVAVGLAIDVSLEVPDAPPPVARSDLDARLSATRFGRRVAALVSTMLNGGDLTLTDAASGLICRLPAKGYRATEFDMSLPRAEALMAAARRATSTFLDELEART